MRPERDQGTPGAFPGARSLRLVLTALLLGGTAVVCLHTWAGLGGSFLDGPSSGWLYDLIVVAAGIACLVRAAAVPSARWAWIALGLAILCWAGGEIYWSQYILHASEPPYPSPADAFYLAFYPLAYAGLALLVLARAEHLNWRLWTDGLIAALGTAALGAAFVFDFVAGRTSGTSLEVAVSLAYPLGDIAMVAMIIGVIALTDWRLDRTWALLLGGLGVMGVADIAYSIQSTGGVVPAGNWIDPLYLVSAAILGSVLWLPTAGSIEPPDHIDDRRALAVPALFATLMIGLAAVQYLGGASGLSTVLWAGTIVAVVARLTVSVRENRDLLEQVRTDPLTQLRNRGALELELDSCCARATEERPAALAIFDLNHFKRYNDTLGHPAGDELLVRLGGRLRDAIGADGTAYRSGGDEFCVLLRCEAERVDEVMRGAHAALSATGPGFEVTASSGIAAIPFEAATPSEALRLADMRMYAHKESRRVVADPPGAARPVPARGQTV